MITQSVGVPRTIKVRLSSCRQRSGSCRVIECEAPLWFFSGAMTHTSEDSCSAMLRRTSSPSAPMPSSLVTRMRIASGSLLDLFQATHVGAKRLGDEHRSVGLLVVLQDRNQRAPDGEARAVQRVHIL